MFKKIKTKSRAIFGKPVVPKMVKFLIKKGIVKTERQALVIVLGVSVISIGLSVILINQFVVISPAIIDTNLISSK